MRLAIDGNKMVRRDGTVLGEIENISVTLICPNCGHSLGVGGSAVAVDVSSTTDVEIESKDSKQQPPTPDQASFLPDPVNETWSVYVQALERPRAVLTPKVRRWIVEAHTAVGVDETRNAIRGLAASDYHRTKGYVGIEYAIRPKQNETIEGRIEMMATKAPQAPASNGLLSVEQLVNRFDAESRDMVWEWIGDINRWALQPNIENTKAQADRQLARLRHNGYEAVIENGRVVGARTIV